MTSVQYGYFGPQGTFTQMALASWLSDDPAALAQAQPFSTVPLALAAVRSGEIDQAMVPIENSVEGGVSATLDALNSDDPLVIQGEVLVPITFVLAAPTGVTFADIHGVGSHSHAWPQVRGWMAEHLPEATYVPTLSTAAAAAGLAASSTPEADRAPYEAAVCAPMAAEVFGLGVLAHDIGDNRSAVTRFVLVSRPGAVPEPSGADKTTLVLYQFDNHPGGLMELLEQFAARGINLTRLESRPTGGGMGDYCFSIDFEGHVADERVGETLMSLKRVCAQVRFLGSYRRADGRPVQPKPATTDAAFEEARAWLRSLRNEG